MEGANIGVNDIRRPSSAVPPAWLEPKQQPYSNVFVQASAGGDNNAASTSNRCRSPTRLNAAAIAEAKSLEEGYRMNVPPKILINVDPHDNRKYHNTRAMTNQKLPHLTGVLYLFLFLV